MSALYAYSGRATARMILMTFIAMTIAGSDPSGGAGIQADLKTFHQMGVYGTSIITLVTVQNTERVCAVNILPPQIVEAQLEAVLEDIPPSAAKTGALGNEEIVSLVAAKVSSFGFPLVVDPVMSSKNGYLLLTEPARAALVDLLLPHAFLVTPNLHEAAILAGMPVDDLASMEKAAVKIASMGPAAVLVKGGHLKEQAVDLLYWQGSSHYFRAPLIETRHTHGTGCTYSACITAELAKGRGLLEAVSTAKRFITRAIETSPGIGKGAGPINHHAKIDD